MPSAANLRRHFLPWDRPLAAQAAAWLALGWDGRGPLDLSALLVVVPTRHAGRRLREALAGFAAEQGQAVFPPVTQTPDALLAAGAAGPEVAGRLETLLAWTGLLREIDLSAFEVLLPVAPPVRTFSWAAGLAENFTRLQLQLAEAGLRLGDVAGRAGPDFPEAARWSQLAELEARHDAGLAAIGRSSAAAARVVFARAPAPPAGLQRVVLAAVPDPLPLALTVVASWAETLPVDVLVFAPESEAASFDAWGRPLAAAWERRPLLLPDFGLRVHVCADAPAQAERMLEAVRGLPAPDGWVALGVADEELLPQLENGLARAGLASFDPAGRTHRGEGLRGLLAALAAFVREPSFEAIARLARCPDFLAALGERNGPSFSAAHWLRALDGLQRDHLPSGLAEARRHAGTAPALAPGLAFLEELRAALGSAAFPAGANAALALLFGNRRLDLSREGDARLADAAEAWREAVRPFAACASCFAPLAEADAWDLALRHYAEVRWTEDKPAGALELQGWLELPWEDAPHLVVGGVNDLLVPEAVVGDAFLPETLRATLGLKTNAARLARDAYQLQALAASRPRLDLVLGKVSAAGDPLRPSRLLLQCADDELPERVRFLFRPLAAARPHLAWTRAWRLAPRLVAPPGRVPVTGLRQWLECPFRFYLRHVLRLEAVDPGKRELDALDFGTLCHGALEAMGRDEHLRDCTDEKVLADFLLAEFDRAARRRLGAQPALPVVIQLESARQRLAKAAAVQARERAAGWRIAEIERPLSLDLAGLTVRGKLDRLDRHEETGAWRVLDYKTSDTAVLPARAHLRPARTGDAALPDWMRLPGGRPQVWADLQLPLYLRALEGDPAQPRPVAGYFNLPKAVGDTGIALWPELTADLRAAASACAEGVAAAIRRGEFWPPAELSAERDPFAALFHQGAEASVRWEGPARSAGREAIA